MWNVCQNSKLNFAPTECCHCENMMIWTSFRIWPGLEALDRSLSRSLSLRINLTHNASKCIHMYIYVHIKCIYIYMYIIIYIYCICVCVCTCIPVGVMTSDYWWCTFQHARRRIASSARDTLALWKLDVTSRAGVSQNPKQHCKPSGLQGMPQQI